MIASRELTERRRRVHDRALANLMKVLGDQARRSGGRLAIERQDRSVLMLQFRDVRTLVRSTTGFAYEVVDFAILLAAPDEWPWDPGCPLVPLVLRPDHFRHPNSDGRFLCLDLEGVLPERVAPLLLDNLRLKRFRLDDPVERDVASFVRSNLDRFPTDERPLLPKGDAA